MSKQIQTLTQERSINYQTLDDFKASLLIVSVVVNLTVLTAWLLAQSSDVYAAQLMSLF